MRSITENAILTKVRTLGVSGIEVAPNISPDGLSGCKQYIAPSADPRTMLFVTNGGAFGRGIPKTGIALNGEYLFYRNLKQTPVAVRLRDITSVEYHPSKQHKDSTYHSNDRIILHCGNKADRHMEDCLIGCDCLGMTQLLQQILEIAAQMKTDIQNLSFNQMHEDVHIAYFKILCNFCFLEQKKIAPNAMTAIHNIADRVELSSSKRVEITNYIMRMEQRETVGKLVSDAAQQLSTGGLNILRAVLLFDVIYLYRILHHSAEEWIENPFIVNISKALCISSEWLKCLNGIWDLFIENCYPFSPNISKTGRELYAVAKDYGIPVQEFQLENYCAQATVLRYERNLNQNLFYQNLCLLESAAALLPEDQKKQLKEHAMQYRLTFMKYLKENLCDEISVELLDDCKMLYSRTQDNEDLHLLAYIYAQSGDRIRMEKAVDVLKSALATEFDIHSEIDQLYKIVCCQMNRKMYQLFLKFQQNAKKALKEEYGIKDSLGMDLLHYSLLLSDDEQWNILLSSGKFICDLDEIHPDLLAYGCIGALKQSDELIKSLFMHTTSTAIQLSKQYKKEKFQEKVIGGLCDYVERKSQIYARGCANEEDRQILDNMNSQVDSCRSIYSEKQEDGSRCNNSKATKEMLCQQFISYRRTCLALVQMEPTNIYESTLYKIFQNPFLLKSLALLEPKTCSLINTGTQIFVVPSTN
ncbi:MAG: hypothetical protein SO044_09065, partial [Agathobaculum sp.]|uniref:hypothetical protein n=1 Tax=Agathobaculum sp. TaxID=2048138 RepID=UPI002A83AA9D